MGCGGPECAGPHDQFGHGMMQYFGQDTVAAVMNDANPGKSNNLKGVPYDFGHSSRLPESSSSGSGEANSDPALLNNNLTNFFFYNKIGDLGFLGYTATLRSSRSRRRCF